MEFMKKLLSVLLIMFAMSAPLAAQAVDCGCEDKPLPEILGVVNGVKITKQDLSPETRARVEQLQRRSSMRVSVNSICRSTRYCLKAKRRSEESALHK